MRRELRGSFKGPRRAKVIAHWRMLVFAAAAGAAQPALARGGGGPPGWAMTLNYCRETVTNKGIADVTRFEQEVRKCVDDPVTYPPAYK